MIPGGEPLNTLEFSEGQSIQPIQKAEMTQELKSDPFGEQRKQIDEIDNEILRLLNDRALVALEIGKRKRERNIPVYVPEREKAVLERLAETNPGPLSNRTIIDLYESIISHIRELEEADSRGDEHG